MACRLVLSRSISLLTKQTLNPTKTLNSIIRPLSIYTYTPKPHLITNPSLSFRSFATSSSSSLNDPNPNWSNRPPKETILLDGCDFEHWLVVVEPPSEGSTRDDIIAGYIKTLAQVVGSEEKARMKIYSVSTKHYFAFGALVDEELSYKLKEIPGVRWVLPDSYLDVRAKDYGGEPFINGEAVPYDPKYHAEWVKNNARANERNRRNDRPRNSDRSRNFERRDNMQNQNRGFQGNQGGSNPPPNMGPASQVGPNPPSYMGSPGQNMGQMPVNMGQRNIGPNNMRSNMEPNNMRSNMEPNNMMPNNIGRVPQNNTGYAGGAPNIGQNYQNRDVPGNRDLQYQSTPNQNRDMPMPPPPPPPQQNREFLQNYEPGVPGGNNSYQPQNVQGRDMPPFPSY